MPLDRLLDQTRARTLLERMVRENRLPHALLFWGAAGVGKSVAAIELARWLNCQQGLWNPCTTEGGCDSCRQFQTLAHAHFTYVMPLPGKAFANAEAGELTEAGASEIAEILKQKGQEPYFDCSFPGAQYILIGQIRALWQWASRRAFEGKPRVALIAQADRLREEAANALLKLLEEPPPDFILILTAPAQEDILPTLRSRCQAVEFDQLSTTTIENVLRLRTMLKPPEIARIARLCGGNLASALDFAIHPQEVDNLFNLAINVVRHSLGRNPIEFDPLLEKWSQSDPAEQTFILEIIASWLRDAALVQALGEEAPPRILFQDRLELLQKFVANCPQADFIAAVEKVDLARRRLEGNALAPLTLISLSRDLYQTVYQKAAV